MLGTEVVEGSCLFACLFKQKTAYEMRISDWSSDVCSSDLGDVEHELAKGALVVLPAAMGLFEKGVGQRLDRLAERFGQPLGLGRVEVESRDLDGRCGDIRQLIDRKSVV